MPCLAYCRKTTKQLNDVTEMCIFQIQIKLGLVPRATGKQTSISVECCIVHTCTYLHTMPKNVSRLDNFSLMHSKNSDFLSIGVLHDFISNKYFKCNWFFSVEWKNCIFLIKMCSKNLMHGPCSSYLSALSFLIRFALKNLMWISATNQKLLRLCD